jgi:hypothetical protein
MLDESLLQDQLAILCVPLDVRIFLPLKLTTGTMQVGPGSSFRPADL